MVVDEPSNSGSRLERSSRFLIDLPSPFEPAAAWQDMLQALLDLDDEQDPGVIEAIAEVRSELARRDV